jgi:hypothetical protein
MDRSVSVGPALEPTQLVCTRRAICPVTVNQTDGRRQWSPRRKWLGHVPIDSQVTNSGRLSVTRRSRGTVTAPLCYPVQTTGASSPRTRLVFTRNSSCCGKVSQELGSRCPAAREDCGYPADRGHRVGDDATGHQAEGIGHDSGYSDDLAVVWWLGRNLPTECAPGCACWAARPVARWSRHSVLVVQATPLSALRNRVPGRRWGAGFGLGSPERSELRQIRSRSGMRWTVRERFPDRLASELRIRLSAQRGLRRASLWRRYPGTAFAHPDPNFADST